MFNPFHQKVLLVNDCLEMTLGKTDLLNHFDSLLQLCLTNTQFYVLKNQWNTNPSFLAAAGLTEWGDFIYSENCAIHTSYSAVSLVVYTEAIKPAQQAHKPRQTQFVADVADNYTEEAPQERS